MYSRAFTAKPCESKTTVSASKPQRACAGLYVITPAGEVDEKEVGDAMQSLLSACGEALRGGARILQYRRARPFLEEAAALRDLCKKFGALFIVNDDPRLAAEVEADGAHLGQSDMPLRQARKILGARALIGKTCHHRPQWVREAEAEGADYAAMGAMFASPTKPQAVRCPLAALAQAVDVARLPIVAIGGIGAHNAAPVVNAGASALAVSSAVFGAKDMANAAATLAGFFEDVGGEDKAAGILKAREKESCAQESAG